MGAALAQNREVAEVAEVMQCRAGLCGTNAQATMRVGTN